MKRLIITLLFLFYSSILFAQDRPGYEFLRNDVSARSSAMGGAFVAVTGDINSLFNNPAGLAGIDGNIASFTYFNHLLDFKGGTFVYGKPVNEKYSGAVGFNFIDYGDFEGRDESGNFTGNFSANNIVLNIGAGYNYSKVLKIGLKAKIIYSKIAGYSSDAFAFDIGGNYLIPSQAISIGLSIHNFGFVRSGYTDYKDNLPFHFRTGLTKRLAHLPLMLSFESRYFNKNDYQLNFGGEFTLSDNFKGRIGYNSYGKDQKLVSGSDQLSGLSLGFGLIVKYFNFDFAFASYGSLGSQSRFTLIKVW